MLVVVVTIAISNYGYYYFFTIDASKGVMTIVGTAAISMMFLGPLVGVLNSRLSPWLVRFAKKMPSRPATMIAGRDLALIPRPAIRATIGISVLAMIIVHGTLLMAIPSEVVREARAVYSANAGVSLQTTGIPEDTTALPGVGADLGKNVAFIQIDGGIYDEQTVYGTCEDLVAILGSREEYPPTATSVIPQANYWIKPGAAIKAVDSRGEAPARAYVILFSIDQSPLPVEELTGLFRDNVSPVVGRSIVGENYLVPAIALHDQARWFALGGVAGLMIIVIAAAVALGFEVLRSARRYAGLGVLVDSWRFYLTLGAGVTAIPIMIATLCGVGIALAQAATEIILDDRLQIPWVTVGLMIVIGVAAAAVAAVSAAGTIRKSARVWRSGDEE